MSILDDIPDLLAEVAGDLLFYDARLTKPGALSGPRHDPTRAAPLSLPCKALVVEWGDSVRAGGLVHAKDRKILILSATLDGVPEDGDSVTIRGVTHRVTSDGGSQPAVVADPANATWTCRGRT